MQTLSQLQVRLELSIDYVPRHLRPFKCGLHANEISLWHTEMLIILVVMTVDS